jgi:hypothetical protein
MLAAKIKRHCSDYIVHNLLLSTLIFPILYETRGGGLSGGGARETEEGGGGGGRGGERGGRREMEI